MAWESVGSNLFQPTAASGNPITDAPGGTSGMGTLQQGYVENSNVDVVAEFVQMIVAQRAYESNSKIGACGRLHALADQRPDSIGAM